MRRVNVMLDQGSIEKASDIGSGNLSAGLRAAVKSFPHPAALPLRGVDLMDESMRKKPPRKGA